jgi:hypothetical protein
MLQHIIRFVSDTLFRRIMRRTGKLYTLTWVSMALAIIASVFVSEWNFNSSEFHLWLDLVPHGFGVASMITSTLIVSLRARRGIFFLLTPDVMAGDDCERE